MRHHFPVGNSLEEEEPENEMNPIQGHHGKEELFRCNFTVFFNYSFSHNCLCVSCCLLVAYSWKMSWCLWLLSLSRVWNRLSLVFKWKKQSSLCQHHLFPLKLTHSCIDHPFRQLSHCETIIIEDHTFVYDWFIKLWNGIFTLLL